MPGYRPGVFRKRHHYRPKRRVAIRTVAAVVAEECRLSFVGAEREPLEFVGTYTDPDDLTMGRAALEFVGIWCREGI